MPTSLQLALQNKTNSSQVYAFITGQAIQKNGAIVFVKHDSSLYYPANPPAIGTALAEDCSIPLGNPENTVNITLPQIAGGRIWFSEGKALTFLLNPGPAIVEPSVLNPSDSNINTNFSFCEFTLNDDQIFANISYVDFVSNLPIALTLTSSSDPAQYVTGMPSNGLELVCEALRAQTDLDSEPWDKLIVTGPGGNNLRALSPNNGRLANQQYFANYYKPYVQQVYQHFSQSNSLTMNTQSQYGVQSAKVENNQLTFGGGAQTFAAPSTGDIFSCSTGPFQTGSNAERNAIIPRLAAAFNRSTLLATDQVPAQPSTFYKTPITNHYSRIVHSANADGKGYAFPYDDVQPDGGVDQSGKVESGNPVLWTVAVGGGGVSLPTGKLGASAAGLTAQQPEQQTVHQDLKRNEAQPAAATAGTKKGGVSGLFKRLSKRFG